MNREKQPRRGDVYYADLNPAVGSEQGGIRPVLILQNNTGNRHSPTVIAAAITGSSGKAQLPTHVTIRDNINGLNRNAVILLEQLRTIDKKRLEQYISSLPEKSMRCVDHALTVSVGLGHLEKSIGGKEK